MTVISQAERDERNEHLETIIDEMILKIMLNLTQHGYSTAEILAALDDVSDKRHHEYHENSGSKDDVNDEVME